MKLFFFLKCLMLVAAVRVGLTLVGYVDLSKRIAHSRGPSCSERTARRIGWGVTRAAQWVPGATCLTQAIAARAILAHYGHNSEIRIGVRRDSTGALKAHAWLMSGSEIVVGDDGRLPAFAILTDLRPHTL